ncbi:hypothetical protein [Streptomyces rubiginosohelvolus]|uniref:hypothetical protein n=1 Tax=Streptomyces rubiginosohelvolus TaxID=67362 RepID=UPI0035D65E44
MGEERLAAGGGPEGGEQDVRGGVDRDERADAQAEIAEDAVGAGGFHNDQRTGGARLAVRAEGPADGFGDRDGGDVLDQNHVGKDRTRSPARRPADHEHLETGLLLE